MLQKYVEFQDEVVRFAGKDRHPIFVEPCGENTEEMYLQGASSSLPEDCLLYTSHPLAGDGKYGSRVKGSIALQSCGLQFLHPETGKPMAFMLPLPDAARCV